MSDRAVVHINRPKKYIASLCKIDVYLDGQKLTSIGNGQSISLEVVSGFHSLHCQFGKKQSETIEWQAMEGQPINLECEFIDWRTPHVYWGCVIAIVIFFSPWFWLQYVPYIPYLDRIPLFLPVFVQWSGTMWSFWLHDKQWGKQRLRLFPKPEEHSLVRVIPSPCAKQHLPLIYFIGLPFAVTAGFVLIYVLLLAIFP